MRRGWMGWGRWAGGRVGGWAGDGQESWVGKMANDGQRPCSGLTRARLRLGPETGKGLKGGGGGASAVCVCVAHPASAPGSTPGICDMRRLSWAGGARAHTNLVPNFRDDIASYQSRWPIAVGGTLLRGAETCLTSARELRQFFISYGIHWQYYQRCREFFNRKIARARVAHFHSESIFICMSLTLTWSWA